MLANEIQAQSSEAKGIKSRREIKPRISNEILPHCGIVLEG